MHRASHAIPVAAGIALGFGSVYGAWPWRYEWLVSLTAATALAVLVVARRPTRPFAAGFLDGILLRAWTPLMQAGRMGTYRSHNPHLDEVFGTVTVTRILTTGTVSVLVFALLVGTVAALLGAVARRRARTEP